MNFEERKSNQISKHKTHWLEWWNPTKNKQEYVSSFSICLPKKSRRFSTPNQRNELIGIIPDTIYQNEMHRSLYLIQIEQQFSKSDNYARFRSKSGRDQLKMKFFVKNSSLLNKRRISCLFTDRQSSFSLSRAHPTLENMCDVHLET